MRHVSTCSMCWWVRIPHMAVVVPPGPTTELPSVPEVFYFDFVSADGTKLRGWTNDPDCLIDGPTVLLCNGLGTNPWTTPSVLAPDSGIRVVSWNHRGTGGSDRPLDRTPVGVDSFVEDAVAVLDDIGVARSVLMGRSIGVNTMFALAFRHPERVSGLFAFAGVDRKSVG